jgi:hypothetical protein
MSSCLEAITSTRLVGASDKLVRVASLALFSMPNTILYTAFNDA